MKESPQPGDLCALWVLHTWIFEEFEQTSYLNPRSPEKQSGKTGLLEVLEQLCPNPGRWTLPSEAAVYRTIEAYKPTLLLDEIDAIWNERNGDRYEGLPALLNSGNRHGASVPRCVGANKPAGGLTARGSCGYKDRCNQRPGGTRTYGLQESYL